MTTKAITVRVDDTVKEQAEIMLEDMPYSWPAYQMKPEYRQMVLEDHLLFYIADENERKVKVYRVLYAKMDIPKHINRNGCRAWQPFNKKLLPHAAIIEGNAKRAIFKLKIQPCCYSDLT